MRPAPNARPDLRAKIIALGSVTRRTCGNRLRGLEQAGWLDLRNNWRVCAHGDQCNDAYGDAIGDRLGQIFSEKSPESLVECHAKLVRRSLEAETERGGAYS